MKGNYTITGRIRDENNQAVEGYTVQAFNKGIYSGHDDRLGKAKTDNDGTFIIKFTNNSFNIWLDSNPNISPEIPKNPKIYLIIKNREGRIIITTATKENVTRNVNFQIKLGRLPVNPLEPDLYADTIPRMLAALSNAGDAVDLSRSDIRNIFEFKLRAESSWFGYQDRMMVAHGYDGIQVPEQPRKESHDQITRWDRPVL